MAKYEMTIVDLTLWRGNPEHQAWLKCKMDKFVADHTYTVDDFDNLPSSGEIWDDIFPFIQAIGYTFSGIAQDYDGYEWFVMEERVVIFHLFLHEVPDYNDDDTPVSAYEAVINRSVDQ